MSSIVLERNYATERTITLSRWRQIETPAMWFVLLNCLDAAITYIILMYPRFEEHQSYAVEANHFAQFFLERWGFTGMFAFKLASAVLVCAIAYVIARTNLSTARRTLNAGSLILLTVVLYSAWLAHGYIHS